MPLPISPSPSVAGCPNRKILDHQIHRPHSTRFFPCVLPVRFTQFCMAYFGIVQQSISTFLRLPASHLLRQRSKWFTRHTSCHFHRSLPSSLIPQDNTSKLPLRPFACRLHSFPLNTRVCCLSYQHTLNSSVTLRIVVVGARYPERAQGVIVSLRF